MRTRQQHKRPVIIPVPGKARGPSPGRASVFVCVGSAIVVLHLLLKNASWARSSSWTRGPSCDDFEGKSECVITKGKCGNTRILQDHVGYQSTVHRYAEQTIRSCIPPLAGMPGGTTGMQYHAAANDDRNRVIESRAKNR